MASAWCSAGSGDASWIDSFGITFIDARDDPPDKGQIAQFTGVRASDTTIGALTRQTIDPILEAGVRAFARSQPEEPNHGSEVRPVAHRGGHRSP